VDWFIKFNPDGRVVMSLAKQEASDEAPRAQHVKPPFSRDGCSPSHDVAWIPPATRTSAMAYVNSRIPNTRMQLAQSWASQDHRQSRSHRHRRRCPEQHLRCRPGNPGIQVFNTDGNSPQFTVEFSPADARPHWQQSPLQQRTMSRSTLPFAITPG